jgi:hypothetical protein
VHALALVITRIISNSHVFIVMGTLDLDGNSSVVFEIDVTTCDSYKVDMGASPHEAYISCAFEVPLISPNKSKILDAKIAFNLYFPHSKH